MLDALHPDGPRLPEGFLSRWAAWLGGMGEGTGLEVSATGRARLEAVVAGRSSQQKRVWRAKIILATADGLGTKAIMRRAGVSRPCVWRWQAWLAAEGVDGTLRDRTRPSRRRKMAAVLWLLRGEDLETVSRTLGVTAATP